MSLWDAIVAIFWFMLLVAWFWLVISVIADIFRDDTLGGWAKAGWCVFVILFPWIGVLVYMIARGRSMGERSYEQAVRREEAFDNRIRSIATSSPTSTGTGVADELGRLADLVDRGRITPAEYETAKRTVLANAGATNTLRPVSSDAQT
jgi:hypothetical protein